MQEYAGGVFEIARYMKLRHAKKADADYMDNEAPGQQRNNRSHQPEPNF